MSKKDKKNKEKDTIFEEPRKAVIIGETFTNLLNPIDNELPYLLLPVCGIPIIEYMLDSLNTTKSKIEEIIIVVKNHADAFIKYIDHYHRSKNKKNKGKKLPDNKNIRIISSDEVKSVGDCLRKINSEKLISNDFLLIHDLVITNINYDDIFDFHLKNKEKDKNCLLTTVLKNNKNNSEIKTDYDENLLIYDNNTKKIYQYESTCQSSDKLKLNNAININKTNINNNYIIRSDLMETGIEICSYELLNIMAENFDFHSIRDSLIKQILDSEIYMDTFYLYELGKNDYSGSIRNAESYLKVNFEILNKWAFPLVIEHVDISPKLHINLEQKDFSIYSDKGNNPENYNKANLVSELVLSKNNIVEENSTLQNCIFGKKVKIGKNCNLYNCIIFPNCIIEDNVIIKNSIIGENCHIKENLKITSSIFGKGINQTSDSTQERIFYETDEEEKTLTIYNKELFMKNLEDTDALLVPNKKTIYGFNDDNLLSKTNENEKNLNMEKINYELEEFLDDDEEESSSSKSEESEEKSNSEEYKEDIEEIIISGIDKKSAINDIVNELSALKSGFWEKTYEESLKVCLHAMLSKLLNGENFTSKDVKKLTKLFKDWKGLFKRFVTNKEVELHLISVIEQLCIEMKEINSAFHIIIQVMNSEDCEIIKDETILEWNKNEESYFPLSNGKTIIPKDVNDKNKKKMKKYIEENLMDNDEEDEEGDD